MAACRMDGPTSKVCWSRARRLAEPSHLKPSPLEASGPERVLRRRERSAGDISRVCAGRVAQRGAQVGIALDEPWRLAAPQPRHVLPDEHLGIAVRAGAA